MAITRKSQMLIFAAFILTVAAADIPAQTAEQIQAERQAALEEAGKVQQVGPIVIPLGTEGEISLPSGYTFIPAKQAVRVMNAIGNPTEEAGFMGMVFLADSEDDAFITIEYATTGHIKDDDAHQISNADGILAGVRSSTEEANKIRKQKGHSILEIQGWAEKPRYDKSNHRLVWAINAKDDANGHFVVNYNTRVLGRTGVFVICLITAAETLPQNKHYAESILAATKFLPGRTYADYDPNTDHTATYGLTGLILGGGALIAAKKFGLLALMIIFFKKGWIIILLVIGALWKLLFGGKTETLAQEQPNEEISLEKKNSKQQYG
jgi:uncharacterized membrane-anchored protein